MVTLIHKLQHNRTLAEVKEAALVPRWHSGNAGGVAHRLHLPIRIHKIGKCGTRIYER